LRFTQGALDGFSVSWSPNSRWLTYSRDLLNYHNAVFIFDAKNKKLTQATTGFYDFASPTFDPTGKYLYVVTGQSFQSYYSDIDNSFIYANSRKIGVITLKKSTKSVLAPKNDTVLIKLDQTAPNEDKAKEKKKDSTATAKKAITGDDDIDFDGFETRLVLLPPASGNYGNLGASDGKIIYQKYDNTGAPGGGSSTLKYWDIEKQEEKTIIDGIDGYTLSANGEKILVQKGQTFAVISAQEGQKIDKILSTGDMQMTVDPVQEWKQIFVDAWRIERDFFYDANMHGVDWNKVKERYLKILEGCSSRDEVNFVIGEMLGELNSSHTYKGGGDDETEKRKSVGYLGVDWAADGSYYKIKKIIRGAVWDAEARSVLDAPGVEIKEGDYILAVNGTPLTTDQEPFAAFQGLANKTVELTYNSSASFTGAKKVLVQTMGDEYRLRYLAWVESNRKTVEEATHGDVGYIYVPSTGTDGQDELIRQFNAQWDKKALVIDERFNSGGQIPDRFIEMLNRTPLAFWAIRDGATWPWPPYAHFGPKVMLINGWSGSGGDAFPDFFRKKGLGPLIGKRTWGGLIGISGTPSLIDGGSITAPSFRMYNPDGTWFKEGHGVDPDVVVDEDLASMAKGIDPQLQRAITEIKKLLEQKPFNQPVPPPVEKRN
jgi:tricorn protease